MSASHILTFLFPNAFGIPIKNRDRRRKVTKERRLFAKCSAGKKIALRGCTRSLFSGVALLFLPIIASIRLLYKGWSFFLNEATSLASTALIMCHHRLCGRNAIE